jgi:hypothetical protein
MMSRAGQVDINNLLKKLCCGDELSGCFTAASTSSVVCAFQMPMPFVLNPMIASAHFNWKAKALFGFHKSQLLWDFNK